MNVSLTMRSTPEASPAALRLPSDPRRYAARVQTLFVFNPGYRTDITPNCKT